MKSKEFLTDLEGLEESTKKKLNRVGINSLEDLTSKTKKEVKSLKGFGPKAILEIEYFLSGKKKKFKQEKKINSFSAEVRKRLVAKFLTSGRKINWGKEMASAERILSRYEWAFLETLELKVDLWTLSYFFNKNVQENLDKKYLMWKTPQGELAKEDLEILDFKDEKIGEDKVIEKPKSLKDFLN